MQVLKEWALSDSITSELEFYLYDCALAWEKIANLGSFNDDGGLLSSCGEWFVDTPV